MAELTSMDLEDSGGIHQAWMESIRGFLLYVIITDRDMIPYYKGLSLMLDSLRPYVDEEGWGLQGG